MQVRPKPDYEIGKYKLYVYDDYSTDYGQSVATVWKKNDKYEGMNDMPAVVAATHDNRASIQEWYHKGMLHRDDLPAKVMTYLDGNGFSTECKEWYKHGDLHKENGPALIVTGSDGVIYEERWMKNGQEHRVDGPSHISKDYNTGIIVFETWMQNGEPYRADGGPFSIERCDKTGEVRDEIFYNPDTLQFDLD